jgi:flagellar motor protein MotB
MFVVVALVACSGARPQLPLLADVERARAATAQEGELAPEALAEADAERGRAKSVYDSGDDIAASLYAERAIAAYQRTRMVARSARATADAAKADAELTQKNEELHALEAARKTAERDGDELAKRLLIARELKSPAMSGPADAQREAARLQASRALAMQARLLCGAAKLVSSQAAGLDVAMTSLDALDKKLEASPKTAPIDEAARARTTCLSILTTARRAVTSSTSSADVLLSELSAASLSPTRDERGIVVTLRDVFHGNAIDAAAQPRLEALGRVASAHGDLPIQIVVHDAVPMSPSDDRAKAVAAALVKGGAKADKIAPFMAGTRSPVVDPSDARNRSRNARVEVVFVTP